MIAELVGDTQNRGTIVYKSTVVVQSLDWNGGMEWWNGIVECVLKGERSLLLQFFFFKKVGLITSVCNQGPAGREPLL